MNYRTAVAYGAAIWAFVFVIAILAFPLRANERPLFESIMPVALVLAVTVASARYLRNVGERQLAVAVRVGLVWLAVNLLIDALAFSSGPMRMSFIDYLKDIGVTYLIIPIIPIGFGYALEKSKTLAAP
jgi:hypothetical protein